MSAEGKRGNTEAGQGKAREHSSNRRDMHPPRGERCRAHGVLRAAQGCTMKAEAHKNTDTWTPPTPDSTAHAPHALAQKQQNQKQVHTAAADQLLDLVGRRAVHGAANTGRSPKGQVKAEGPPQMHSGWVAHIVEEGTNIHRVRRHRRKGRRREAWSRGGDPRRTCTHKARVWTLPEAH
jgi:hypothetical protein